SFVIPLLEASAQGERVEGEPTGESQDDGVQGARACQDDADAPEGQALGLRPGQAGQMLSQGVRPAGQGPATLGRGTGRHATPPRTPRPLWPGGYFWAIPSKSCAGLLLRKFVSKPRAL